MMLGWKPACTAVNYLSLGWQLSCTKMYYMGSAGSRVVVQYITGIVSAGSRVLL